MVSEFEKEQLKKFREGKELTYNDASVYTVLLGLVEDTDIEEVFMMLHNVACDLDKRKELEGLFKKAKSWKWD